MPWLKQRWVLPVAGLLGLIALSSPQHYREDFHSANEASRIYATLAIVDHSTLRLDPVFDRFFPGWRRRQHVPNADVAVRHGHYLTDKAPGITLLSVPVVLALRMVGVKLRYSQLAWLLALLLSALPSLLFLGLLWRWLRQTFGADSPAVLVAPALVLASPWLIYCAQLFGHALAASLVGAGLLFALGPPHPETPATRHRPDGLLGGLCLGGATLVEYPAGLLALAVCLAVAFDPDRRRRLGWIVLGGLGPAVVLLTWNTLAFGDPLSFSYGFKAHPTLAATHDKGIYGISWPSAEALYGLLLSPRRGLLFLAPWMAIGLGGLLWGALDRGLARAWRMGLPLGFGVAGLLIAGFADWHGGRALGPRYLVFALPLLGIGAALLLHRSTAWPGGRLLRAALAGLALSSLALGLAGHLGFAHVSHRISNPLFEVVIPVWLAGGPGPTAWGDCGTAGALLTVAAALGLLTLLVAISFGAHRQASPNPSPPGPGGRLLAPLCLVGAAVLHLALATIPTSTGPRGRRRVLAERAFAHQMLGQPEAARRALQARRRLGRRN